ncbi:DUF2786 domain-containing protein [Blastococcus sp. Marseille-P5729]|uniref:DUF2786 domain-containing protein n=1 Tax=Blastococcus sp. Marseille-P5729 TaxID=2086582 RepID=UPI000D108B7A|nr:DUF2786 domain-containing protein [Blastococcus sp. Marseille-P5729]
MGKNNKARRAAKAKQRAKRAARQSAGGGSPYSGGSPYGEHFAGFGPGLGAPPSASERQHDRAAALWQQAIQNPEPTHPAVRRAIEQLTTLPAAIADQAAQELLIDVVDRAWSLGWQPVELVRQVRRKTNAGTAALVELAIHADDQERAGQPIDPRWAGQVRQLGQQHESIRGGWLGRWRERAGLDRFDSYLTVKRAFEGLFVIPRLEVLIPPPGRPDLVVTIGAPERTGSGDPILERIRKLLSKAESTEFEEEASSLTAKAQELMTRHAIDEALLAADDDPASGVRIVRIPVDAPYADAKATLLGVVAAANRARAIHLKGIDLCSVLGSSDALAVTELLFTSLLVQAQNALAHESAGAAGAARRRTRSASYRASFYAAFASRIGERLSVANDEVVGEAGSAALVLSRQVDAVDEAVEELYGGTLESSRIRGAYDYAGFAHGRQAADRARLRSGELREA